ncbi:MAG: iron export ABC transporter permease subunit FetB [Candidatus Glassbacteria bacterium]|nr:iron export ABC transporter permease subunit FetB [Candidatus Glassbacteria bacterium]
MTPRFYDITVAGLLAAFALALPVWLIIWANRLRLGRDLWFSILRMALQLLAIGFVLEYLFEIHIWYVTVGVFVAMVFFAARTVLARTGIKFGGLTAILGVAMLAGAGSVSAFLALAVVQVDPWYAPRYFIPLAGMVLGNSMNGCALALERFYSGVREQRKLVETHLAHGATGGEATRDLLRSAFRASLIPTLSSMSGIGLVFIPGMMTGQILGGVDPLDAIRYQMVIMMAILGSVALASFVVLYLERGRFFDEYHLLRNELFN